VSRGRLRPNDISQNQNINLKNAISQSSQLMGL